MDSGSGLGSCLGSSIGHGGAAPDEARRLHLGIDTGGTFTDAALLDAQTHEIIATAKSLTTKHDLARGVIRSIESAVASLPPAFGVADIAMVSVSTTLATNAVIEGHGDPVAAFFIGFDDAMVARTGVAAGLSDVTIMRIGGGHDHAGREREPLDLDALRAAAAVLDPSIRALAICSAFATRNPDHERRAADALSEIGDRPVTISGELSSGLDAPRRALTTVLNARLIGRTHALIGSVREAMAHLGLDVTLMLVKGDGTRARADAVARRPIETVLSGPAASMVGAAWLCGRRDFIGSDIGGTTTDVGVVLDGRMVVSDDGASVGGWRTMVRAADLRTVGLGGDSDVRLDGRQVVVGPQRVVPLSLLADRYPALLELLAADEGDERNGGASHGRFVLSPTVLDPTSPDPTVLNPTVHHPRTRNPTTPTTPTTSTTRDRTVLDLGRVENGATTDSRSMSDAVVSDPERLLLNRIGRNVLAYRTAVTSAREARVLDGLRRRGLVQLAAFTPTDAAHVLDLQHTFSVEAARCGARLLARLRDMTVPSPERAERLAHDVWAETVRRSAHAIVDVGLRIEPTSEPCLPVIDSSTDSRLLDRICSGAADLGLLRVQISSILPIVAVGGPAKVFYAEVGKRLGAEVVFPPNFSVANAVGAATGVVSRTVDVTIETTGEGTWRVHSSSGVVHEANPTAALATAEKVARSLAQLELRVLGGDAPDVTVRIAKTLLPGFDPDDDLGLLSARITAVAVAAPRSNVRE